MLAVISGDIVQHTISLLDSLSLIVDPNTEVGLEYTKRFTEMKDSQIYTIDKIPKEEQDSSMQDPIDYVFNRISNLYRDNQDQYKKFKELFSLKEYMNDVMDIVSSSISFYINNKHFDKSTQISFDKLIERINICPSPK